MVEWHKVVAVGFGILVCAIVIVVGLMVADKMNREMLVNPADSVSVQVDYCYNSPDICDWKPTLLIAIVGCVALLYVIPFVQ